MAIVPCPGKFYSELIDSPPSATGPFISRVRKVRCPKTKPRRLNEEFASLQKPWLSPDSAPSAARAVKKRQFIALVDDEDGGRLESGGAEIRVRVRRATLRKLEDEFDQEVA